MAKASISKGWRRLEPIALLVYLVRFVRQVISNALPALIPAVAVMASMDGGRKVFLVSALIVLALIALAFSLLSYWRFAYRIDSDRLLVRQGVFSRENLTIDFARVQTVNINTPFYSRWVNAVTLGVDTAGSAGKETTLPAVPKELAETFRLRVAAHGENRQQEMSEEPSEAPVETVRGEVLAAPDTADLARYGLSQINLIWVTVAFGFIAQFVEWDDVGSFVQNNVPWLADAFDSLVKLGLLTEILVGIGLFLLLLLVLAGFSVLAALFKYHGFRLSQDSLRFVSQAGLLNTRQQSLRLNRVQAVEIHQNALALLFGRVKLVVRLTTAGATDHQQISGLSVTPQFVVPGLTIAQAKELIRAFQPGLQLQGMRYTRPDSRFIFRHWLYLALPPAAIVTLSTALAGVWPISIAATVVLLLVYPLIYLRWLRHGIAVNYGHVGVRSGFVGFKYAFFDQAKCQRVDVTQSRGQRRRSLGSLGIHLTSHTIEVPWLAIRFVTPLRDLLLYQAAVNPMAGVEHLPVPSGS